METVQGKLQAARVDRDKWRTRCLETEKKLRELGEKLFEAEAKNLRYEKLYG